MDGSQALAFLQSLPGYRKNYNPELAQPPKEHLAATEETAAALPNVDTTPGQFTPQSIGPDLVGAVRALATPSEQLPIAPAKPWQPPAEKCGAIPQQDELIRMSKGETSAQFTDTRMSFQAAGLIVRQRGEAISMVQDSLNKLGAALNQVVDAARAELEKRQRESGEWPPNFQMEGPSGARCGSCRKFCWGTVSAWKHVQRGCPVVVRLNESLARHQPCEYRL